jgi:hypothetical protein
VFDRLQTEKSVLGQSVTDAQQNVELNDHHPEKV